MNRHIESSDTGWHQITVACKGAPKDVRARIYWPFAVHRDVSGERWAVTHIRTGVTFERRWVDRLDAADFAHRMRELVRVEKIDLDTPTPETVASRLVPHVPTIQVCYEDTHAMKHDGIGWSPELYMRYREKA